MRSLETEVSRLREAYAQEITAANVSLQQSKQREQALGEENDILKEILNAHGIPYEAEVGRRKAERAAVGYQYSPFGSSSPSSQTQGTGPSYATISPPTTVSTSTMGAVPNGTAHFDVSPTQNLPIQPQVCQTAGSEAGMLDRSGSVNPAPVQAVGGAVGGIFEEDPQLQIDFILTYVPVPTLSTTTYAN